MGEFSDVEDPNFSFETQKSFNLRNIDWKSRKTLSILGAIALCLLITFLIIFGVGWFLTRDGDDDGESSAPSPDSTISPTPSIAPSSAPSSPLPSSSPTPASTPSFQPSPGPTPDDSVAEVKAFWETVVAPSLLSSIDPNADPCDDFYQYACGNWIENFQLPSDKTGYIKSFNSIDDNVETILHEILEADWPLIGPYYKTCMDLTTIDNLGSRPLIQLINDVFIEPSATYPLNIPGTSLSPTLASISTFGFSSLFEIYVQPDSTNPSINLLTIDQGGLGMPTPDYYLNDDPYTLSIQSEYKSHMGTLFGITFPDLKQSEIDDIVSSIFDFETQIANFSLSRADHRNPVLTYNKMSFDDLQEIAPDFDWQSFFETVFVPPNVDELNVAVPKFFEGINRLLTESDQDTIQNYITWLLIENSAIFLGTPYLDEIQRYSSVLTGRQQAPPRWKLCMSLTNSVFGELLGRYFVMEAFDSESKVKAQELIDTIKQAFANRIPSITWMDEETKQAAIVKLNAVNDKIGYPDKWNDYAGVQVFSGSFLLNAVISYGHAFAENMEDAGNSVDRSIWYMDPQDVNAYYDPLMNEMVFPAAILQPPFYHKNYPDALNFGAIGAVMGHELTHGFDDEGRQFDAHGFLHQWWTDQSIENFDEQTQCVIDAYSNFPLDYPGHINGEQTLGENLADMGGVKDAYEAFQLTRRQNSDSPLYKLAEDVFGMTNEQLLFLSYGQVWCTVMKEEQEVLRLSTDVHSPSKARVDMPLANTDYFSDAFQCKANTQMNPPSKCNVW